LLFYPYVTPANNSVSIMSSLNRPRQKYRNQGFVWHMTQKKRTSLGNPERIFSQARSA